MAKLFLSHASSDKPFVKRVAEDLQRRGHFCWLDEWSIKVGQSIVQSIEKGVEDCDYVLLFLSTKSVESKWVDREWRSKYWGQINQGKTYVLPCLIEKCTIPKLLTDIKYANFAGDYDRGMRELLEAISPVQNRHAAISFDSAPDSTEVTSLISRVYARKEPLSACIAEGLGLARNLNNAPLEQFCRDELAGVYVRRKGLNPDDGSRAYRQAEAFASKIGVLNPAFIGFQNEYALFQYITTHPDEFTPMKLVWGQPVTEIEAGAAKVTPTAAAMQVLKKYGDLMPGKGNEDLDVPVYMRPGVHEKLLESIRREFVNRLLACLPAVDGTPESHEEVTSVVPTAAEHAVSQSQRSRALNERADFEAALSNGNWYDFSTRRVTLALTLVPANPPAANVDFGDPMPAERIQQMSPYYLNWGTQVRFGLSRGIRWPEYMNEPATHMTVVTPRGSLFMAADWLASERPPEEVQPFRWGDCEEALMGVVPRYVNLLRGLKIEGPLLLGISLMQTQNTQMTISAGCALRLGHGARVFGGDRIVTQAITINDAAALGNRRAVAELIRPAMEHVWGEYNLPPITYQENNYS